MPALWPEFTWDAKARQYRSASGRFAPRKAIRAVLDAAIDRAATQIEADARLLQIGAINLPEWQLRTEAAVKLIHTASAAVAAGGWAQATAADWSKAATRIKQQYKFLERFARQIEAGLPLDGRFLARAASYASAGAGTYEAVLRRIDLASKLVISERRITHSLQPCGPCFDYEAMGWTDPGTLPDTGQDCECHSRCRCSFERQFARLGSLKFKPSDRARDNEQRTVWVDVGKLDAGFQKDKGFAIKPGGKGAIPGRLAEFRRFLRRGTPIEQPEVTVDDDGTVSFTNGRHRFAVLRDMGMTKIPVSVDRSQVTIARKLFGAK